MNLRCSQLQFSKSFRFFILFEKGNEKIYMFYRSKHYFNFKIHLKLYCIKEMAFML